MTYRVEQTDFLDSFFVRNDKGTVAECFTKESAEDVVWAMKLVAAWEWVWKHQADVCLMDHGPSIHLSWKGPEGCSLSAQSDNGDAENPDPVVMLLQAVERAIAKQTKFENAFRESDPFRETAEGPYRMGSAADFPDKP